MPNINTKATCLTRAAFVISNATALNVANTCLHYKPGHRVFANKSPATAVSISGIASSKEPPFAHLHQPAPENRTCHVLPSAQSGASHSEWTLNHFCHKL